MTANIKTEFLKAKNGELGLITLNRPEALNALNFEMISRISDFLNQSENNNNCFAIVIQGLGEKAFCAGGDIKSVYLNGKEKSKISAEFFNLEYAMNTQIYNFKKPYIALLHGITMGGGLGVSIHGSHKISSNNLTLAMPETGIGFFPDIGGSFFLSRIANEIGIYLGLTGDRIGYLESLYIELINYTVDKNYFNNIINVLLNIDINNKTTNQNINSLINEIIIKYQPKISQDFLYNNKLHNYKNIIKECFSHNTIPEIINALLLYLKKTKNSLELKFINQTIKSLKTKSPTSLAITLRLLKLGKKLSFNECMKLEHKVATAFLNSNDFYEGIRASVIDKDNNPKWDEFDYKNIEEYYKKYHIN